MNRQHKEALSAFSPQGLCTTQENPIRATGKFFNLLIGIAALQMDIIAHYLNFITPFFCL